MDIVKETLFTQSVPYQATANVIAEHTAVLDDEHADMREIYQVRAEPLPPKWEVNNGKLSVSGEVIFSVLYKPDGEDAPEAQSFVCRHRYTDIQEASNAHYTVSAYCTSCGFHMINSRKLTVKTVINLQIACTPQDTVETVVDLCEGNYAEKKAEYRIFEPVYTENALFSVHDFVTLPDELADMETVLDTYAVAEVSEVKVVDDKHMIRGILHMTTRYIAEDAQNSVVVAQTQIPFAEIADTREIADAEDVYVTLNVVDLRVKSKGDTAGNTRILAAEAEIAASFSAWRSRSVAVVADCYGTDILTDTAYRTAEVQINRHAERRTFTKSVSVPFLKHDTPAEIVAADVIFYPKETRIQNDTLHISGNLFGNVLWRNTEGALKNLSVDSGQTITLPVKGQYAEVQTQSLGGTCRIADGAALVTVNVNVYTAVFSTQNISFVTDVYEKPQEEDDTFSLAAYFTQPGDTLWSIAKRYRTTEEKIRTVNHMKENDVPKESVRLLIPG